MSKRLTTDEFISKAILVHGNEYDYSHVKYINTKTKVQIICKIHGEFLQVPNSHLSGNGCMSCHGTVPYTTESFISKSQSIHGTKYDYSNTRYMTARLPVIITCPIHGQFNQIPDVHLKGSGCLQCKNSKISNTKRDKSYSTPDIINKFVNLRGNKFDYSNVLYNGFNTNVTIICNTHGEFEQSPHNHLKGYGCLACKQSKGELAIEATLTSIGISFLRQHTFDDCKHIRKLPFDFYVPSHKLLIEYDGEQHSRYVEFFSTPYELIRLRDNIKTQYCIDNSINLLRIPHTYIKSIPYILHRYFGVDNRF